MYPDLFTIGGLTITSFGVMVACGVLVGLWVFRRELDSSGLPVAAADVAAVAALAGFAGAKMLWVLEHLHEEPVLSLMLARGGLSWFGGLFVGLGTALLLFRKRDWPIVPLLAAATPALAIGHLLGRIGCFLVGDDYGSPTNLPWGVAFPRGVPPTDVPVHPTQLYEAIALAVLAIVLVRLRRAKRPPEWVLGVYLSATGTIRFLIEFLRINERVLAGLTVAHIGSLLVLATGVVILSRAPRTTEAQ